MKRHGRGRTKQSSRFRRGPRVHLPVARRGRPRPRWVQSSRYQVVVPALKRRVKRRPLPSRLISASLLIVAGWLIYLFANDDAFYIRGVQAKGNWRLSEAELFVTSGLEGVNIFWANTRAAAEAIEALPDVVSARVRCGLPADCEVNLVERPASLVWQQGEARVWIGADGVAVPARGELPNAVVLDAAGSTALKPGERLNPALVAAVKELERLQPVIRVYRYSDRYGLIFENDYGWPVRLGGGEEIATKLMLLQALTDYLLNQGIEPAFIDVRYPEAPYYRE